MCNVMKMRKMKNDGDDGDRWCVCVRACDNVCVCLFMHSEDGENSLKTH